MTRGAYAECFAGASGDMILGALIDAGWPEADFRAALGAVPLGGWEAEVGQVKKGALRATQVRLRVTEPQPERDVGDILPVIEASDLPAPVKARASALFLELAEVEGREHQQPPQTVHFHEVGAVGLHPGHRGGLRRAARPGDRAPLRLAHQRRRGHRPHPGRDPPRPRPGRPGAAAPAGGPRLRLGVRPRVPHPHRGPRPGHPGRRLRPLPGDARRAHRLRGGAEGLPHPQRPAPLRGHARRRLAPHPVPAGVAGPRRGDRGTGRGTPIPTPIAHSHSPGAQEEDVVVQLETNVDDMSPEWYGHLSERLLAEGALDVSLIPALMKKGRPGTLLSVLVPPEGVEQALGMIFAETTTLGVRVSEVARRTLGRRVVEVETPYGPVRVKLGLLGETVRSAAPEYEDCHAAALRAGVPLRLVYEAASRAAEATGA